MEQELWTEVVRRRGCRESALAGTPMTLESPAVHWPNLVDAAKKTQAGGRVVFNDPADGTRID